MRFIDSNVLAYAFYENEYNSRCQQIIREGGITNTVNIIEAFNIIEHQNDTEFAVRVVKSLLKSNIRIINVDINLIFETLKRKEANKKLDFIDLVHYTTALINNCNEFASFDRDFDDLEIKRIN